MTDDPLKTASQCRHYAMCKIDYLETGLCPSGPSHHYVAFYPQGRMDIYAALKHNLIPLTPALIDIADTCTLCGICDKQCYFVTGMRPMTVMKALKAEVESLLEKGTPLQSPPHDEILHELHKIVGTPHATNDPAVLITYADDPFPLKDMEMPRIVVLPSSTAEVSAIAKLARAHNIPTAIRGSGASVYGMVFTSGIVIDTARMKEIAIDPANYSATVSAGVTAFELQRLASHHNLRANTAEPAATVCGNIICTGLFSTWGASYGTFADNFIDLEIVNHEGRILHLSDPASPNLYAYKHSPQSPPGICTRAIVPLYPVTSDEDSLLVPFTSFDDAILFARELNLRRIGLSIAVLGPHYIATFLAPTLELANRLKENLPEIFGIEYAVLIIADSYDRDAVNKMAPNVIDSHLLKTLMLGLPRFLDDDWLDLVRSYEGDRPPYEILSDPTAAPLIEAALKPSPQTASQTITPDLRAFYTSLYAKPQYTDPVWLSQNRIVSCRMGRHKHIFAFLVYLPADDTAMFNHLNETFAHVASELNIDHDFGFVTPMGMGKRAVYEYDYYLDQTSNEDKQKAGAVMQRIIPWLDDLALNHKGLTWIKTFFSQGCVRKEGFFYEGFIQRKPE
jgi:hypothetical protein